MDIGIFKFAPTVEGVIAEAKLANDQGFTSFWMPQIFGLDALTAFAVTAKEVPNIQFGTGVVPTYRQHPMMMAQQALTVSQVAEGRLTLGIGLSHQVVVESMWGYSYSKPLRHMREFLEALVPLLNGEASGVSGEAITSHGGVEVEAPAPKLMIAALGPKMLELAGRVTDGTVTWMVGPNTLADHIVPIINQAADAAGRPQPGVAASIPVCVTNDVDDARARAAKEYVIYGQLPSYRAMLDREGAAGPEDIAVIGSADEVSERLAGVMAAGATTLVANEFGTPDELAATRDALQKLL